MNFFYFFSVEINEQSINQRFIDAVEHLKISGAITKYSDLANELGCSAQVLSEIRAGRMKVQLGILQNIFIKFRISYDFIFTNKGPILYIDSSAQGNDPCPECKSCKEKDRTIAALSDNVDLLKEKISRMLTVSSKIEESAPPFPKTA